MHRWLLWTSFKKVVLPDPDDPIQTVKGMVACIGLWNKWNGWSCWWWKKKRVSNKWTCFARGEEASYSIHWAADWLTHFVLAFRRRIMVLTWMLLRGASSDWGFVSCPLRNTLELVTVESPFGSSWWGRALFWEQFRTLEIQKCWRAGRSTNVVIICVLHLFFIPSLALDYSWYCRL